MEWGEGAGNGGGGGGKHTHTYTHTHRQNKRFSVTNSLLKEFTTTKMIYYNKNWQHISSMIETTTLPTGNNLKCPFACPIWHMHTYTCTCCTHTCTHASAHTFYNLFSVMSLEEIYKVQQKPMAIGTVSSPVISVCGQWARSHLVHSVLWYYFSTVGLCSCALPKCHWITMYQY